MNELGRLELIRESLVANPGRQQHAFEKCSACVYELIQGWPDRPGAVSRRHADTLERDTGLG